MSFQNYSKEVAVVCQLKMTSVTAVQSVQRVTQSD